MNFNKRVNGSWVDTPNYIHNTSTDTLTTLPTVLYLNDTTATVGLKGDMEQSGTPTPTTPIQPQECGEKTGNLVESQILNANIAANGQIISFSPQNIYNMCIAKVEEGETYCFYNRTGPYGLYANYPAINSSAFDGTRHFESTITIPNGVNYIAVRTDYGVNLMVVKGTTPPTSYEPYGVKIPILSNSTTTPVYLGEVETTRRIKKLVLDGTENWLSEEGNGRYSLPNITSLVQFANQLCTHFQLATSYSDFYFNDLKFGVSNRPCLLIHYIACQTVSAFKAFLAAEYAAGHPVTVWYVLPTPQTAVVNEPLRKIGTYADEVSGITIPTIAGANTLSVDTTVQPSEITVNYKGWHPVTDVHERENGAWT